MLDTYRIWRDRRSQATYSEIAEEMGVTRAALERAIQRDRARGRIDTTALSEGQKETTMNVTAGDDGIWGWVPDRATQIVGSERPDRADRGVHGAGWDDGPSTPVPGVDIAVEEEGSLLDRLPPMTDEQRDAAVQRLAEPARADDPAELQARIDALHSDAADTSGFYGDSYLTRLVEETCTAAERQAEAKQFDSEYGPQLRLSEDIAAGAEPVRYSDAGATIGLTPEERDQWRAPGTAGHDEEQQRWEEDYEDRSADRSEAAGF